MDTNTFCEEKTARKGHCCPVCERDGVRTIIVVRDENVCRYAGSQDVFEYCENCGTYFYSVWKLADICAMLRAHWTETAKERHRMAVTRYLREAEQYELKLASCYWCATDAEPQYIDYIGDARVGHFKMTCGHCRAEWLEMYKVVGWKYDRV